jgi:hypothetical protein
MKKINLLFIPFFGLLFIFPGVTNAQSAFQLRSICLSSSAEDGAFCRGYIFALAQYFSRDVLEGEIKSTQKFICLPKNLSQEKLKEAFIQYTDTNTDFATLPADVSVNVALRKKYPCKNK